MYTQSFKGKMETTTFVSRKGSKFVECKLKRHLYGPPLAIKDFFLIFFWVLIFLAGFWTFWELRRHQRPTSVFVPDHVDDEEYDPFEPEVEFEFEPDMRKDKKIPRIIHQTWKNTNIPPKFIENIQTFVKYNPDWEYYLWTDESADNFVRKHHPELLSVWDGYLYKSQPVRRADAIRYIALYHFGGLYIDMDVVNYQPMDNAITKHDCVIIPEPFEQSVLRAYTPFLMSNAIMMCRPKHPFFKHLIDNLSNFGIMQAIGDATGPGYLTTQFKFYLNLPREKDGMIIYGNRSLSQKDDNSPYFYKGRIPLSDERSIYVPNTQYFLFSLDDEAFEGYSRECRKFDQNTLLMKRLCANIKRRGVNRLPNTYSITDHRWVRTYGEYIYGYWYNFIWKLSIYNYYAATSITDIVPTVKIYQQDKGMVAAVHGSTKAADTRNEP